MVSQKKGNRLERSEAKAKLEKEREEKADAKR